MGTFVAWLAGHFRSLELSVNIVARSLGKIKMSHADGLAILPNGEKFHFEYNGTVDICCTRLYKEYEDLHKNWRNDNHADCVCVSKKYSKVILSNAYARWDFMFESEICIECMCIVGKICDY
jgi:hypothetical protein